MKHNSSPFAQSVLCTPRIAALFSCFANIYPTQQTFFAALTRAAKKVCCVGYYACMGTVAQVALFLFMVLLLVAQIGFGSQWI